MMGVCGGEKMKEREREREICGGERKSRGTTKFQNFQILNYERKFHKIHINKRI